jgi:hypothetical protein
MQTKKAVHSLENWQKCDVCVNRNAKRDPHSHGIEDDMIDILQQDKEASKEEEERCSRPGTASAAKRKGKLPGRVKKIDVRARWCGLPSGCDSTDME